MSKTKLQELLASYHEIYDLETKCWSSLPLPPCNERTYVITWMLISDNYFVNHNKISWVGSNPNTFIHVWSIIDRIKVAVEHTTLLRTMESRTCSGYYVGMGLTGRINKKTYSPKKEFPNSIANFRQGVPRHVP